MREGPTGPVTTRAALRVAVLAAAFALRASAARAEAAPEGESALDAVVKGVLGFSGLVGQFSAGSVTYWNFPPVTDVKGRLVITESGDWRFEDMTAAICGGRMTASVRIGFRDPGRELRFEADFAGMRLEEITRFMKVAVSRGLVSSRLSVRVTSEGRSGLDGQADLHLREGNLGEFAVVATMLGLLAGNLPGFTRVRIEEADARMTLTPAVIRFQTLGFRTRDGGFSVEAERGGSIAYDGDISLYLKPCFERNFIKSLAGVGDIVDTVLRDIQERAMRIRVTGSVSKPAIAWSPFR